MDSGAECWFYSCFTGDPGGAVHDSSRRGLENVVFPLVLQCFSRDQSVSQPWASRGPAVINLVSQVRQPAGRTLL